MDAYKTPNSNLEPQPERPFRPIKALVYGLLISVGVLLVVSAIEMFIVALLNHELLSTLQNEDEINQFFAQNTLFLAVDLVISFVILYLAGTMIGRYATGYEWKFAVILALLTLCIHLIFYNLNENDDVFPMWYSLAGFASIFVAILWGAKAKP
jgi:magnesium-transporting ATPase (P-type)